MRVSVAVRVGEDVRVADGVRVEGGVRVLVGVRVGCSVRVGVCEGVVVGVGTSVGDAVGEGTIVFVGSRVAVQSGVGGSSRRLDVPRVGGRSAYHGPVPSGNLLHDRPGSAVSNANKSTSAPSGDRSTNVSFNDTNPAGRGKTIHSCECSINPLGITP